MENRGSYSKEPDYLTHGFEYRQQSAAPSAERPDVAPPRSALLCNGTANNSPQDLKEVPQNNNVLEESQHERKGRFFQVRGGSRRTEKGPFS